ncbi:MAG: TetR/AcrR family transcriptional regulator [Myxococcales bacterium]|nr:TetR/AcrR family transcriptional regulator [Myxococcales bacterium]MCB9642664.1 TetR/AcrR family transcriptional regulator [Myxococcales bacterium]
MKKKTSSPMKGLERRSRRILETAVKLAEKGGFSAVRLRDIAAEAGVALGTVYKRFQSKEDILIAILQLELTKIRQILSEQPPEGTNLWRVKDMLGYVTHWLCVRPNLSQATIKAVASGEPALAEKVSLFHSEITALIIDTLRGKGIPTEINHDTEPPNEVEKRFASCLQHIWFSMLIAWSGGLQTAEEIEAEIEQAAHILARGLQIQEVSLSQQKDLAPQETQPETDLEDTPEETTTAHLEPSVSPQETDTATGNT